MKELIDSIPVIYEDDSLLIIDKPIGLVIHAGAGGDHWLLTDWLTKNYPEIIANYGPAAYGSDGVYRPGIVHRLDKETSGLLMVAKTPAVGEALKEQFKAHRITKEYVALVVGQVSPANGRIESYIRRHPQRRQEMTVSYLAQGKPAVTHYQLITYLAWTNAKSQRPLPELLSLLRVTIESGRMHQIRVHLKEQGWPILGDQSYNTKASLALSQSLDLRRQFLHALRLAFLHPITGQALEFKAELPKDLKAVLNKLNYRFDS